MKLLIANGYIVDPSQRINTGRDLLIEDGRVVSVLERGEVSTCLGVNVGS